MPDVYNPEFKKVDWQKPITHTQGDKIPVTYMGKQTIRHGAQITDEFTHLVLSGDKVLYVDDYGRVATPGRKSGATLVIKNKEEPKPKVVEPKSPKMKPGSRATEDTPHVQMDAGELEEKIEALTDVLIDLNRRIETIEGSFAKAAKSMEKAAEAANTVYLKMDRQAETLNRISDAVFSGNTLVTDELRKVLESFRASPAPAPAAEGEDAAVVPEVKQKPVTVRDFKDLAGKTH